ncbi:MAG: glutamate--tRNA ligase, partial [Actinomycetota bacterium]|nr:glutamate--tRNA ligase [Actinomycetota bacterium]
MTDPVLGDLAPALVRVRFPPSPTGNLHVGNVRSALFNWVFARHYGGRLVLRIEDTDLARHNEEAVDYLMRSLEWLGIDWDEGPGVGGPHEPYRQSERFDVYADIARRLLEAGRAYYCYCSVEELDERRERARSEGRTPGYDGHCRALTQEQAAAFRADQREPVLRLRMPDHTITFDDLVRGEISFEPDHVPDFVLVRGNGHPLYTLVNPVDDALMQITHVLRGEDLLSSTPRQIALYDALRSIGVGVGPPRFGHLPIVMGEGNRRLSKRDAGAGLDEYRERGFLPEGLLNYLALLGWAIADDRDIFDMREMIEAFDVSRVNPNPARFDLKKCEAINAVHLRALPVEELAERMVPHLQRAGLLGDAVADEQRATLLAAAPLVSERMTVLGEAVDMLGFLFVDDENFAVDPDDAAKVLTEDGLAVVKASHAALESLPEWTTPAIEAALREALVDKMGLKPRHAFGPVRVAVTGRKVSPPLFESLELLGRERSLH